MSKSILNKPNLNEQWSANSGLISTTYFSVQRCRFSDKEFCRLVHMYTLLRRNCHEKADIFSCLRQRNHYVSRSLLYYVAIDVTCMPWHFQDIALFQCAWEFHCGLVPGFSLDGARGSICLQYGVKGATRKSTVNVVPSLGEFMRFLQHLTAHRLPACCYYDGANQNI